MASATRPRRRPIWLIPLLAVVLDMGLPTLRDGQVVPGPEVGAAINEALAQPLVYAYPVVFPLAKLLLVAVGVLAMVGVRWSARVLIGYFAVVLVVVGLLQNMADLGERGFVITTGNIVVMLALAVGCLVALRWVGVEAGELRPSRLWVVPLAALAAAFPFREVDGLLLPGIEGTLTGPAGVTFCMVAAVVAAAMYVRPGAYPALLRVAVGSVGTLFGLLNAVTWFVFVPASWWMGVLHLPLLVCSLVLAASSWRAARVEGRGPIT